MSGQKVLDVGCGAALAALSITKRIYHGQMSLMDIEDIRDPRTKDFSYKDGSAVSIPHARNEFDVAYMQYVAHHMVEPIDDILRETYRVAKSKFILVEEVKGKKYDESSAKVFDKKINDFLHPNVDMPVHRYYTHAEIKKAIESSDWELIDAVKVNPGTIENGFIDTYVYVLVKQVLI